MRKLALLLLILGIVLIIAAGVFIFYLYPARIRPMAEYRSAAALQNKGDYVSAALQFEGMEGFRDAAKRAKDSWIAAGEESFAEGDLAQARTYFLKGGANSATLEKLDSAYYQLGVKAYANDERIEAENCFSCISDGSSYLKLLDPVRVSSGKRFVEAGDYDSAGKVFHLCGEGSFDQIASIWLSAGEAALDSWEIDPASYCFAKAMAFTSDQNATISRMDELWTEAGNRAFTRGDITLATKCFSRMSGTGGADAAKSVVYCDFNTLPPASEKRFAVTPTGLYWSDGYCWRTSIDNSAATNAGAYLTIRASDGTYVSGKNENMVFDCFSTTKLMTALLVVENIGDLSQYITVNKVYDGDSTALEVKDGDMASYESMLNIMLVYSDNVAADCLGRYVGHEINPNASTPESARSTFFSAMQRKAEEIGMTSTTNFISPHGGMRSSPEDMCKLFNYINKNCPLIMSICAKESYTITVSGRNPRTWTVTSTSDAKVREILPEFVAAKTGSSDVLGAYCLIWEDSDGQRYVTTLMDSPIANYARYYNARQIVDEVKSVLNGTNIDPEAHGLHKAVVTIDPVEWIDNKVIKVVNGITPSSHLFVEYSDSSGSYSVEQSSGILTFACEEKPAEKLTVNIMWFE